MTNLVFESPNNVTAFVFRNSIQSGTSYGSPIAAGTPHASVATLTIGHSLGKVLTPNGRQNQVTLTKSIIVTKAVNELTTNEVFLTTAVPGALNTVSEATSGTLSRGVLDIRLSAGGAHVVTLTTVFNSGSSHSTFFISLPAGLPSVSAVLKGIQTTKAKNVSSVGLLGTTLSGHTSYSMQLTGLGHSAATVGLVYIPTTIPAVRSISIPLVNVSGIRYSGLTGLKWAMWNGITPDVIAGPPTDRGNGGTVDGNGIFSMNLPLTTLAYGQVAWLTVTDSDGVPGEIPSHKVFSGPVTVG